MKGFRVDEHDELNLLCIRNKTVLDYFARLPVFYVGWKCLVSPWPNVVNTSSGRLESFNAFFNFFGGSR